jgi:hypothetical protein
VSAPNIRPFDHCNGQNTYKMTSTIVWAVLSVLLTWIVVQSGQLLYNVFLHPLKAYPGPLAAGASLWWKTYIEVVKQESMVDVLLRLHEQYGTLLGMPVFLFYRAQQSGVFRANGFEQATLSALVLMRYGS